MHIVSINTILFTQQEQVPSASLPFKGQVTEQTTVKLTNWCQFFWCLRIHSGITSLIHSYFENVMTKFNVNNRKDMKKSDDNLFFTTSDCQIAHSCLLPHRINYKLKSLSAYWQWKLVHERARIFAVIVKLSTDPDCSLSQDIFVTPFSFTLALICHCWG